MAKVTVNSLIRDAIKSAGHQPPAVPAVDITANSVRTLIQALDQLYPGCSPALTQAAVAIDGEIYSDAMTEPLDEFSEVAFIPSIEGG